MRSDKRYQDFRILLPDGYELRVSARTESEARRIAERGYGTLPSKTLIATSEYLADKDMHRWCASQRSTYDDSKIYG